MTSTSQLLANSGIANLLKRNVQQKKQFASDYNLPEQVSVQRPQEVSQADIQAQKEYERQLAEYNNAVKENEEWKQAEKIFNKGGRAFFYALKEGGSVSAKLKKLQSYRTSAEESAKYYEKLASKVITPQTPTTPTQDTIRTPVYDTQGKFTGQYRDVPRPAPTPASDNVIIGGKGDVGGLRNIVKGISVEIKDITRPTNKPTPTETSAYTNTRYVDVPKNYTPPSAPKINYGTPINPLTNKPYSVVSMPPTERERFQEMKKELGTIKALANYPSEFVERKTFDYQIKKKLNNPNYQIYQPRSVAKLTGLVTSIGTYSVPVVGQALLFGSGGETILSGRAKEKYNELILQGYSKTEAYSLAYGVPAGEMFLGGYGLKAEGNFLFNKFKPAEQTSFIATIERGEGSVSNVKVISKTGDNLFLSSENVLNIPESNMFLGGGKGFSFETIPKVTGNIKKISEFQVLGGGRELPSANLVKDLGIIRQSEEVGQGVFSRGFQRDTGRNLEKRNVWLGLGLLRKSKFVKSKSTEWVKQDILGLIHPVKDSEGVFKFLGTSKPKIRVYKKGGVSYIIKKSDITGDIFLISPEEEGINVLKAGTGDKTPFSKTFPQLTELEKQSVLSQIPSTKASEDLVKPVKINLFGGGKNILQIEDSSPLMVGGTGKGTSAYSGTGQYEQTESTGIINLPKTKVTQLDFFGDRNKLVQPLKPVIKETQREEQNFFQPTKESQREVSRENEKLRYIQAQSFKQRQEERQKQKQINIIKQIFRQPQKPKTPIPPIFQLNKTPKTKTSKEKVDDMFSIVGRRFGKFSEIGKAKTQRESEDILKGFLKKGLGASGKIFKNERPLEFGEIGLGIEFEGGKRDPTLIVQKRRFRLSTGGERREIQGARKKKESDSNSKNKLWKLGKILKKTNWDWGLDPEKAIMQGTGNLALVKKGEKEDWLS